MHINALFITHLPRRSKLKQCHCCETHLCRWILLILMNFVFTLIIKH